jgi:two-component system, chemotaxis family, protein-glutamate methylesterase/glutaminase
MSVPLSTAAPVRVAICEDSPTYAYGLRRLLELDGDAEVIGVHETAESLLAALDRDRPDLVTMDLELPGMDGIRATEQLMLRGGVPVVVLSAHTARGSDRAIAALAAGAYDAIPKSELSLADPTGPQARAMRRRIVRLARASHRQAPGAPSAPSPAAPFPPRAASAIGIAASTGGPKALQTLLGDLPALMAVPVLVVQHMSAGFTQSLVDWLDSSVPVRVRVAAEGVHADGGVWFAPDGKHLKLSAGLRLSLDGSSLPGPHRPSGDVLLESLAAAAGASAVGVVLTGMGRDGARGIEAIRAAGGLTIAQDEASSTVFGMPRAAARAGAELVLPLDQIGARLRTVRPAVRA